MKVLAVVGVGVGAVVDVGVGAVVGVGVGAVVGVGVGAVVGVGVLGVAPVLLVPSQAVTTITSTRPMTTRKARVGNIFMKVLLRKQCGSLVSTTLCVCEVVVLTIY